MLSWFRKSGPITNSLDLWREIVGGTESGSGKSVTTKQAIQATAALACARVVAFGLAQVPFKLYRQDGRSKSAARNLDLYDILALQPNDWMTSFELRAWIGFNLVLCGQAFLWINRVNGNIVELLPVPGSCVTVKWVGWEPSYAITLESGVRQAVPASDIWHIRGLSLDGRMALDPVRVAREAIGLSLAAEEHGAKMFVNGMAMPGVISTDAKLDKEQRDALRESINMANTGANKWKLLLMWGGMKYTGAAATNEQAQFLETRRFQIEEICRALGVMPIMVYSSDKAQTYASVEAMFQAHLVHTMQTYYSMVEQSAMVRLLTREQRKDGLYVKFVVNALMHASAQAKAQYLTALFNMGALSPNEIRELDERDPYAGGDEFRVPMNTEAPGSSGASGPNNPDNPDATQ